MKNVKNKPVDQKTYLKNLLEQFVRLQEGSRSRVEKYKELMDRKSSKKCDDKKKQRAESRLKQAELEYRQSFEIIEQIRIKLSTFDA